MVGKSELCVDMIVRYHDGIVIIERKDEPLGLALPGGHVEEDETLEAAVARELKEETGLGAWHLEQFRTYADPMRDPRCRSVSVAYTCNGYGKLLAGSDALEARIMRLDDIDSLKDELCFDHYEMLCDYRDSLRVPTPMAEQLWEVKHSYRLIGFMSGEPYWTDRKYYFVASSMEEALEKAFRHEPTLKEVWAGGKEHQELDIELIPLENLVPSQVKKEGHDCFDRPQHTLLPTSFSSKEDQENYRLGITLERR